MVYQTDLLLEEHWRNIDPRDLSPSDRPAERILGRLVAELEMPIDSTIGR